MSPAGPRHDIALWAALAAFFGSLLAIGLFDVLEPGKAWEYLSAFIVAGITAGVVYSKERLTGAKKAEGETDGDTP